MLPDRSQFIPAALYALFLVCKSMGFRVGGAWRKNIFSLSKHMPLFLTRFQNGIILFSCSRAFVEQKETETDDPIANFPLPLGLELWFTACIQPYFCQQMSSLLFHCRCRWKLFRKRIEQLRGINRRTLISITTDIGVEYSASQISYTGTTFS